MFGFIKRVFVVAIAFFSFNGVAFNSKSALECISRKNQECKVREEIVTNKPMFYPFSIKVNKCNGNCNNINNPHSKLCVPDVVRNINLKVFNLISWSNQTEQIKWHESCKCECKLNSSFCHDEQKWNEDKCRYECKKLISCDKGFIWNPSNCECEYKKRAAYSSVEECKENINENETLSIKEISSNDSCRPFIVLFIVSLMISIIFGSVFVYSYLYSRLKNVLLR